ncbi:MAG: N-formylglutamate deformylase [Betaproteobacteria bacterium]|nr:N-formylglutamate deformylase [Betaproteobacteria bacterium]
MPELWTLARGNAPLIVNVPHCGTYVPEDIQARFTPQGQALFDTDWHVDKLYDFVPAMGATLMAATHSRYVADLNRDPDGKALYPGADNTEICPTSTFAEQPIYPDGEAPDAGEIDARIATYWRPYHAVLAAEIERIHALHGYCILLDGHSIISVAPRFFAGRLPDLNLGTAEGASCGPLVQASAIQALSGQSRFSLVVNGRFKGGYITRHYGRPEEGIHALQLEMGWRAYLDEAAPQSLTRSRASALIDLLGGLANALASALVHSGKPQNSL